MVFFNAFRIASLLTGVSRMTLASSSSRRIVQREWPSGTGPQASSISRASTRPSTLRLALSEFMLLLNSVTALTPPFMYFVTVFVTVARQTPLDLALCSWVRTFPCDSSRSRIIWHLQRIVFRSCFLTDYGFKLLVFILRKLDYIFSGSCHRNHRRFFLSIYQNGCIYQYDLTIYQYVVTLDM